MTDFRELCARMADKLDHYRQLLMDDRRETHALATEARAALAQPEPPGPSDVELLTRIETLEAALHKHIMQTSSNTALPKVLHLSDLPQLTPEQMQNLQDLLGTYRNHLGLNTNHP